VTEDFAGRAAAYYAGKLREHGATHRGVDWNSAQSQELRFAQLLRVCQESPVLAINDYGCGYGALVDYLADTGRPFEYGGYDASADMIAAAKVRHGDRPGCEFTSVRDDLKRRPFTIASGVFNVKLDAGSDEWWAYVLRVLDDIASASSQGFAFNLLTSYSDPERRRDDLFYAQPEAVFSHCMQRFSKRVALIHDYALYEFTVLVRL
jgi:SAM-dependent methyltransferase